MNNSFPIPSPPPELVQQWCHEDGDEIKTSPRWYQIMATKAARWGADQELEACCDYIRDYQWGFVDRPDGTKMHRAVDLKFARRPKPPSLKEQALETFNKLEHLFDGYGRDGEIIRRALEALPND
jgi:hypothetical protein